jgi:L-phenylalanine/L-methionine N-acetyltransferase
MELTIRPASMDDHLSVHEILMSPHVLRGTMRVPQSPVELTRERLSPPRGVIQLVADDAGEIVGFAELITHPDDPRARHAGEINLVAVRESWLGKGVGKALCAELVDLADNWLNLTRLGLVVFEGNGRAIGIYERLGFTHEGTMRRFGFGDGTWMDAHMMGRIRPSPPPA